MSDFMATLGNALTLRRNGHGHRPAVVFTGLACADCNFDADGAVLQGVREIAAEKRAEETDRRAGKRRSRRKKSPRPRRAPVETVEAEEVVDDTELIAVIAAAIAAYEPGRKEARRAQGSPRGRLESCGARGTDGSLLRQKPHNLRGIV